MPEPPHSPSPSPSSSPSPSPAGVPARPALPTTRAAAFVARIHVLRADPRAGVVALLVAALAAGLVWYRLGSAAPPPARAPRQSASGGPAAVPRPTPTTTPNAALLVHVAGAVAHPGVVRVASGARVIDALAAAGGGVPGADLDRLNLAAKVSDGERIAVRRVGDTADASSPPASDGPTERVNLNTATAAQLDRLPGIGPTLAAAIVRERERRGGFRSVDELRTVRGIGDRRLADLRDLVTV